MGVGCEGRRSAKFSNHGLSMLILKHKTKNNIRLNLYPARLLYR